MNCRDCSHFNLRSLIKRNQYSAKLGHGYCDKHEGRIPMAGCFCADWQEAKPESVMAREQFWRAK